MRKHLETYIVHSLEVMMYWIPFTDGQLQDVRFLFILVANFKKVMYESNRK